MHHEQDIYSIMEYAYVFDGQALFYSGYIIIL